MSALAALLALLLSGPARATLVGMATSPVELMGCMMGTTSGDSLAVDWVRPLETKESTRTEAVPAKECPEGTLGRVHSHPEAKYCFYVFPGTVVPTSDGVSFLKFSPYRVDAIVCGSKLVWVDRQLNQHEQAL